MARRADEDDEDVLRVRGNEDEVALLGGHDLDNPGSKPSSRQRTLTLLLLVGINLLNYLDRYTVSGVLPELKDKTKSGFSSDLSDSQSGLLMTVFVVSYMLVSPIFGYLGDRWNRKNLIVIGMVLWALFTVGGSFAQNYGQLLAARALVGVGEAAYAVISPTIIADLYEPEVRTHMLSIFYIAIPVGAALGFIVGGQVAAAFGSWRWALRVSPPLGLLLAAVLFFTREPPRGASEGHSHGHSMNEASGLKAFWMDFKAVMAVPTFFWSTLGFTAVTFTTGALAQWAPTYVYRQSQLESNHLSSSSASLYFGGVTVITGVCGTLLGSIISKRLESKTPAHDSYVCGVGMLVAVVFIGIAIPLASYQMWIFWVLTLFGELALCLNWGPTAAITLYVIEPKRRNTAEAVSILMTHLLGDAASPYLVGVISDVLHQKYDLVDADSLMLALLIPGFVSFLGGLAYLRGAHTVAADRAAASVREPETDFSIINSDSAVI
ncbi:uncharacterized protein MONBRDRAFT_33732 [Monosiga brevicollis MX1]|uniref:Major facilitator superfamily (MFS) profile domain-containing protein n=1 Tax=Monosiga brevicollis TaxID=81824 RepID=A9V748_MONBE|nr:uncharacterized protein MONBRDRAFT_33732 [Monosiga brevicollis MX1]EDQ86657.1 predicted protein [Monosiga brevicollis MX1]|eukprot:XP_001748493.1 hypothetical protein [Monosiga brevicollis MX1]